MYSVNGIVLDRPAVGWRLLASTLPLSAVTMTKTSSTRAGRDGFTGAPSVRAGTVAKFEMLVPLTDWETLQALFASPELTLLAVGDSTRAAYGSLRSVSEPKMYPRSGKVSAVFFVDIPAACWQSASETTTALTAAAALGATMNVFSGLSAPVQDAIVRFKGPLTTPQVTDVSGAYVAVDGPVNAGTFVRFESATGRSFATATDVWTGGTEVSGEVDFGGPRGVFEITPDFTNPATRQGKLTLTQAGYSSGAGFQVRGRSAHLT